MRPMFGMLIFSNLGEGVSLWWWIVVSDRALVSCYRPSIQSRKVSVAVLPQFEVQSINQSIRGCLSSRVAELLVG